MTGILDKFNQNHLEQEANSQYLKDSPFDLGQFIFLNLPVGIYRSTAEPEGKFLLSNLALVNMFGYDSLDEFIRNPVCNMYLNPSDRELLTKELISKGQVNRKVFKLKKKNGEWFWGAVTAKMIADDANIPYFFDGAIEDVTEVREKELKLIEERTFSDTIIEALPGMFWLNDEDGRCVRWNKNVEKVYGYTREEIKKIHALKDITSSESLPALMKATQDAFAGGSGYCEYESKTKSGKRISFAGDARLVTINDKKYLACVEVDITRRKLAEEKLHQALEEIKQLKEKTDAENVYLIDEINSDTSSDFIIGKSSKLNQILHIARKVAPTPATVLIQGETGTGKGLLASFIHSKSPRCNRPLIKINCANLPGTLIESILFGHEKGAFTNASSSKIGRFELAHESTIFLDEIAELPLELQSKLLRVIEEGEFERLGGSRTISVDTRIIAATNRDLQKEVKMGNFREDLLFRLNVYPITIPPLRERKEDIPLLTQFFVNKFNKSLGKSVKKVPNSVLDEFEKYNWLGNIRELQNVIERAMIDSTGNQLTLESISTLTSVETKKENSGYKTLREIEIDYIEKTLEKAGWVIEGEKGAAKLLGMNPSTLRGRLRKLGICRPAHVAQF